MVDRTWTILDVLNWTAKRFAEADLPSARLDAELLLADALSTDRLRLYMDFDRPLTPAELAVYRDRVRRRLNREPIAYIIGSREFYSLSIRVTPAVLIPRPETELLVETAVQRLKDHPAPRVIDVGTGSGAIAVAIAKQLPAATVDAVDVDEAALAVARQNAAEHGVADRVACRAQDLLGEARGDVYDLVVSNPPYVDETALADLMPDVRDFEPRRALVAAEGGLAVIRRLAKQAPGAVAAGGALLFEIGCDQAHPACSFLSDRAVWGEPSVLKDLAGLDRAILVERR